MRFDELRLGESIVRAVTAAGYERPTPIQVQAVPTILDGRDVLGCAQTGTGKTAAFAMPVLQRLAETAATLSAEGDSRPQGRRNAGRGQGRGGRGGRSAASERTPRRGPRDGRTPRALVLCPTRELATQIHESFESYGRFLPLDHAVIFGGVGQGPQVTAIRDGVDVLVATPGRLQDLIQQGHIDLGDIEILILDEADQMLDMGFIHDIRRIVKLIPTDRQTLFFSATMPPEIRQLADAILTDPATIETARVSTPAEAIQQSVHLVNRPQKPALLIELLRSAAMERTLVFTRTKHGADKLVKVLVRSGIEAAAIHGNKSQGQRTKALDGFKSGRTGVLVATDIAARGIDVDGVSHVVNFDIPTVPETYVHRIGRTARAGASGTAIALCDPTERASMRAIERLMGHSPAVIRHDGAMPEAEAAPARPGARSSDRKPAKSGARNGRATTGGRSGRQSRTNATEGAAPRAGAAADRRAAAPTSKPKPKPKPKPTSQSTARPASRETPETATGRPAGAARKRIPRRPSGSAPASGQGTSASGIRRVDGHASGTDHEGSSSDRTGDGRAGGTGSKSTRRSGGSRGKSSRGAGDAASGTASRGSSRASSGAPRGQRGTGGRPAAANGSRHGSRTRSGGRPAGSSGPDGRRTRR